MKKVYRISFVLLGILLIVFMKDFQVKADEAVRPEVRALWVDAFHDGAKTPAQIDKLIQDCVTANLNTLIVQVRRRGDAYYNKTIEPRTEDQLLPANFDALQYLIKKAHAKNLEVHAWLNTLVAWNSATPPKDPNHIWNLHGPKATGRANWVSYYRNYDKTKAKWSEKLNSSYYFDPGNPEALDYTVEVYLNVVKNYEIDGIHLDYSRYDSLGTGYNSTNVARYQAYSRTKELPNPNDPKWNAWRREQTANLIRKIYLRTMAIKPKVKVSSSVITWGDGPVAEGDWEKTMSYVNVAQDWQRWLKEGIVDQLYPMNYYPEWNPKQQDWYNKWIEWEKNHTYGRQVVAGIGNFSQYLEESLAQIRRAQAPSALGNKLAGVALFAYGWNNVYSNSDYKESGSAKGLPRQPYRYLPETNDLLYPLLAKQGDYLEPVLKKKIMTTPVFPLPAPIPEMPWKSKPTKGSLMGRITDSNGKGYDYLKLKIEMTKSNGEKVNRQVYTDGSGWYGFVELPVGDYRVWIEQEKAIVKSANEVTISVGQVVEANLQMSLEEN